MPRWPWPPWSKKRRRGPLAIPRVGGPGAKAPAEVTKAPAWCGSPRRTVQALGPGRAEHPRRRLRSVSHPGAGTILARRDSPGSPLPGLPALAERRTGLAGTPLPAGSTQLWGPAVAGRRRLGWGVSGTGDVHAIALSATGAPLGLRHRPVAGRFPPRPGRGRPGSPCVTVLGPPGWDLRTLLAAGRGEHPAGQRGGGAHRPGRSGRRCGTGAGVPAVVVTSSQPRLTTVLPGDCREVLVHLDRRHLRRRFSGDLAGHLRSVHTGRSGDGGGRGIGRTLRYRVRGRS